MQKPEPVVFDPTTKTIIDFVSHYGSSETALSALEGDYGPGLVVMDFAEASRLYEDKFKAPPKEIDAARFGEMLGVLPPMGWVTRGEEESFKLSERTAGNITSIFAKVGDRHFELSESMFMTHAEIISVVRASPAFGQDRS